MHFLAEQHALVDNPKGEEHHALVTNPRRGLQLHEGKEKSSP